MHAKKYKNLKKYLTIPLIALILSGCFDKENNTKNQGDLTGQPKIVKTKEQETKTNTENTLNPYLENNESTILPKSVSFSKEDSQFLIDSKINKENLTTIEFKSVEIIKIDEKINFNQEKQLEFLKSFNDKLSDEELKGMLIPSGYFTAEITTVNSGLNWLDGLLNNALFNSYHESFENKLYFNENYNNKALKETSQITEEQKQLGEKIKSIIKKEKSTDYTKDDVKTLEEAITYIMLPEYQRDLQAMKDSVDDDYSSKAFIDKLSYVGYSPKTKILNFNLNRYMFLGGAHGLTYISPINVDIKSKKIINYQNIIDLSEDFLNEIADINQANDNVYLNDESNEVDNKKLLRTNEILANSEFKEENDKYQKFITLLKQKVKQYKQKIDQENNSEQVENDKSLDDFNDGYSNSLSPSFDFYVTDKGLTFIYQPYAVLPFVYGHVFIDVSYEELMNLNLLRSEFVKTLNKN